MMDTKKNEARFTIKFNPINPRHREAMRLLNEAGRTKASLIADALCMYDQYGANTSVELLKGGSGEIVPAIQGARNSKASKANSNDDDALLDAMVDSAELFFN